MGYTHHIPGRLRVRSAVVKHDAAAAARLRRWIESIPGMVSVQVSVVTGSILVHYDPRTVEGSGLLMLLREEGWLPSSPVPPRTASTRRAIRPARLSEILPPESARRALAKAALTAIAEVAIQRSIIAIAAAIL